MPMSSDRTPASAAPDAGLALRLAQRAFSALGEAHGNLSPLARAQRGHALRRALSALSADDRDRFARWLAQRPALAQSDLMHLSAPGHALVGDSLADAILVQYDAWRAAHPEVRWSPEAGP